MKNVSILWADDEIDLLKIHILFLEQKGHTVATANNGIDAIEMVRKANYDIIFLDENMPGKSGIETLAVIKQIKPDIPVVMITKSEEENIMEDAIGSKIADYLIKPVNPNQILLTIKKNVENKELINKKTTSAYQTEFTKLGMQINQTTTYAQWIDVYKKLVFWELELESSNDSAMDEILKMQKNEANSAFTKFIKNNYLQWFDKNQDQRPLISPELFKTKIFPLIDKGEKVFFILIDNLRYDQWKILYSRMSDFLEIQDETLLCSILPTATQYARNSIFAGLMPLQISKMYPDFWLNDEEEGGKNEQEEELLKQQFARYRKSIKFSYEKILNNKAGRKFNENIAASFENQLNVIVYNFVDMLSHARTEMNMIRELANDESAYRSLTLTWFEHSPLLEMLKLIAEQNINIVIGTDHGTIRVDNPIKIVGDKNTTTNLRYKQGKNLNYNRREVFDILQPEKAGLPITNLSSSYAFATNRDFFAYPNNFNHYVKYYKDTFQHGGISMEEMLIPLVTLKSKKK